MQTSMRRKVSAWLLLSVFVPMMMLTALHHHQMVTGAAVECVDCSHHVHHGGHLSAGGTSIDDCLLCQFLTLNYIAAAAVALAPAASNVSAMIRRQANALRNRIGGSRDSRAPPCLENLSERKTIYLLN